MIHLDTHVAVWLHAQQQHRLPESARRRLDGETVAISPIVLLEIAYLQEAGRVSGSSREVLDHLGAAVDLRLSAAPFATVVDHAVGLTWTRDPFDRMIAAQALADDASLLTADTSLLDNVPQAFWE